MSKRVKVTIDTEGLPLTDKQAVALQYEAETGINGWLNLISKSKGKTTACKLEIRPPFWELGE